MKYHFTEIFDIQELTKLCQSFTDMNGIVTAILDLEANVYVATGWQPICTQFHRINPQSRKCCTESETILAGQVPKGKKYNIYKCKNGLVDVSMPIIVGNTHVGNFFTGQFFLEEPDITFFEKQAEKYGFDKEKYFEALRRAPIYSKEMVDNAIQFLVQLTETIGNIGLERLKNIEYLKKLEKAKEKAEKSEKELKLSNENLEQTITERTQQIRENEQNLLTAQSMAHLGSVIVDFKKKTTKWSEEIFNILGLDQNITTPNFKNYIAHVHPDDKAYFIEENKKSIESGTELNIEYRIVRTDGSIRHLHNINKPLLDKNGKPEKSLITLQDITEQKQQEEQIRKSEERYSFLLKNMTNSVWRAGLDAVLTFISPQIPNLRGYTAEEAMALKPEERFHPDSLQLIANTLSKYMELITQNNPKGWEPFTLDVQERKKDGSYLWTQISGKIVPDDKGNPMEIVGTTQDITRRKQQEAEIKNSQEQLQTVFDSTPIIMMLVSRDGRVQKINQTGAQMTGIAANDAVGLMGGKLFNCIHDVNGNKGCHKEKECNFCDVSNAVEETYATGNNIHKRPGNLTIVNNGQPFTMSLIMSTTLLEQDGEKIVLIGLDDVTLQKQQEEQLTRYKKAIESTNEAIGMATLDRKASFTNRAFTQMFGYTPEEFGGLDPSILHVDKELARKMMREVMQGNGWKGEIEMYTKAGDIIQVYLRADAITNEAGEIIGIMGVHSDITVQKQREAEREKLITQQKVANEQAKMGSWYIDFSEEPLFIHMDENLVEIEGTINKDGSTFEDWAKNLIATNAEGAKIVEKANATLANPTVFNWDETYQSKRPTDGKVVWLRSKAIINRNSEGNPISLYGSTQDVTEQKQQQEEIIQKNITQKLALDLVNAGTWSADLSKAKDRFFISPELFDLFGMTPPEDGNYLMVEEWTNNLIKTNKEGGEKSVSRFAQWIADPSLSPKDEWQFTRPVDGKKVWFEAVAKIERDKKGNATQINGICRDITEVKERQQERERTIQRQKITQETAKIGSWQIDFSSGKPAMFLDDSLIKIQGETFDTGANNTQLEDWSANVLANNPENGKQIIDYTFQCLADANVFDWDAVVRYKRPVDGEMIWLKSKAVVYRNKDGSPRFVNGVSQDVTEQKLTEIEITNAKEQAETALDIAKSGAWYIDFVSNPDRVYLDDNLIKIQGEVFDSAINYCLTNDWVESILKSNTKSGKELVDTLGNIIQNSKKSSFEKEFEYVRPLDKKIVWLRIKANISRDKTGNPLYVQGVTQDITKQKSNELELKRSRGAIQQVLETVPVAVAVVDLERSRIVLSNDALNKMFATDKSKIGEYDTSSIWLSKKERDKAVAELLKNKTYYGESQVKRFGNDEVFWAAQSAIIFEYNGKSSMLISMVDTTEQKQLQFDLEKAQHAADSIVDTVAIPMAVTDRKTGEILRANTAMAKFHGVEMDDFANIKATDWYVNPEERKAIVSKLENQGFVKDEPVKMIRYKTKEERSALLSFIELNYYNTKALVGSITDITDIKETQAELEKAIEKAEAANVAKSTFLANMSHEIRTPMNAIIGFTEILDSMVKDKEQKMHLQSIFTSSKALLGLINDVLDLTKIEAGKMSLNYETLSTKQFVSEIEIMFKERAGKKGLSLECNKADNLPETIIMDELRLRQVAINLVGNAVKFTNQGFVNLNLNAKDLTDDNFTLVMEVMDTGIGIRKEKLSEVFEDFTQEDGSITRNYGGTGLGLSISKRIIDLLKGDLKVQSEVNKGSTFTLEIPKVEYLKKDNIVEGRNQCNPDEIKFEKVDILVVDDIETNRMVLQNHFKKFGFKVHLAENGVQAVEMASEILPDIIFMDLRMPEMDGYTATAKLKEKPETAHIPVIACTASAFTVSENDILKLGFSGYIRKPMLLNEIVDELCKQLKWEKLDVKKEIKIEEKTLTVKEIEQLKQKLEHIWGQLLNRRTTKLSKQFADVLISEGKKMNNIWLSNKGKDLQQAIMSFNVEQTQNIIDEFKEMFKN